MARIFSNRDRPFDLGVLPTELLPRDAALPVAGVRQPEDATLASADALLGATWLTIKTEGELRARSLRWGRVAVVLAAAGVAAISLATPFASAGVMDKWFGWPRFLWLAPLPLLTAAAFAGILVSIVRLQRGRSQREWLPFVALVTALSRRYGAPADYDQLRHGYYYTKKFEFLPVAAMSEAEMFALLVAWCAHLVTGSM